MSWGLIAGIAAPLLTLIGIALGLVFKYVTDKQARVAAAAKEEADRVAAAAKEKADRDAAESKAKAELEAKRAQEVYEQMQEDLLAARTEVRSLQGDVVNLRDQMNTLWSQMEALRREKVRDEAYIAEVHRWDDTGRNGPLPTRKPSPERL